MGMISSEVMVSGSVVLFSDVVVFSVFVFVCEGLCLLSVMIFVFVGLWK